MGTVLKKRGNPGAVYVGQAERSDQSGQPASIQAMIVSISGSLT
jgi:hypothetical protein